MLEWRRLCWHIRPGSARSAHRSPRRFDGQRPLAPVETAIRGAIWPVLCRPPQDTVYFIWHPVSLELSGVELEAFALEVGYRPSWSELDASSRIVPEGYRAYRGATDS